MKSAKEIVAIYFPTRLETAAEASVSEWADTYRYLSAGVSSEPGKWRTERAEYQRAIMDAFTEPGVHRVVVKSAAQIGKSDIMNNVIGRFAHLDPASIMMIQPTVDMAPGLFQITYCSHDPRHARIEFVVLRCEAGRDKTAKTRDGNNTILSKFFPGGRLVMCGANSPAGLASRPIRILLADEVDRFPDSAGTEGDPVDLAAKRMTTSGIGSWGCFRRRQPREAAGLMRNTSPARRKNGSINA